MASYEEHERRCTAKFERTKFAKHPHEHTSGKYDSWDMSLTARTNSEDTYNIEMKNRDIPYDKYADEGFMVEKIKYDALMEAYRETGSKPIFMVFFRDGGYYCNLLDIPDPEWIFMWCTKSTADGTYGNKKVRKEVMLVYPKDGKRFTYES